MFYVKLTFLHKTRQLTQWCVKIYKTCWIHNHACSTERKNLESYRISLSLLVVGEIFVMIKSTYICNKYNSIEDSNVQHIYHKSEKIQNIPNVRAQLNKWTDHGEWHWIFNSGNNVCHSTHIFVVVAYILLCM